MILLNLIDSRNNAVMMNGMLEVFYVVQLNVRQSNKASALKYTKEDAKQLKTALAAKETKRVAKKYNN